MREGIALVRRAEFAVDFEPDPIVAGFRANGWFSIYFGDDLAVTFDEACRLRRAFSAGFLYRTQGETLARLDRQRADGETSLVRHDLSPDELADFLAQMRERLMRLCDGLQHGEAAVTRAVGEPSALRAEIAAMLARIVDHPLQLAPPIPGRR